MAGSPVKSYRDLVVWQRAMDVVARVYRLTATMPQHERYGLSSQVQPGELVGCDAQLVGSLGQRVDGLERIARYQRKTTNGSGRCS